MANPDRLSVACSRGLEELLSTELLELGVTDAVMGSGVVQCLADKETIYRICLESRLASSVLVPLAEFPVSSTDELYKNARLLQWSQWFGLGGDTVQKQQKTFAVRVSGGSDNIQDSQFASLRLKDAIVDQIRAKTGQRPDVSKDRPDLVFHLFIDKTSAIVSLDLAGRALHERGYRVKQGEAPIRETLAAGLVYFSGWLDDPEDSRSALIDPMCGSGTLLIEAALMAKQVAPRLHRKHWGFVNWQDHSPETWNRVCREVETRSGNARVTLPKLVGYDSNSQVINAARENARQAGVDSLIHFERADLADLSGNRMIQKLASEETPVTILTNPPYGVRLEEELSSEFLHHFLGKFIRDNLPKTKLNIVSGSRKGLDRLALQENKSLTVYNGPIRSWFKSCEVNLAKHEPRSILRIDERWLKEADLDHQRAGLANRLVKNHKKLKSWLKREDVQCYRLYDADLPEFNFALDVYGGHVHFQEYKPPKTVDEKKALERLNISLEVVENLFSLKKGRLHKKIRTQQKGAKQYQKQASRNRFEIIEENNVPLLVNLDDYLDVGLFLDHRPVRKMIQDEIRGKSFLNLFAYTATASVHAAVGGATSTVSVDTSAAYLGWGRANFALNGFSAEKHQMVKFDVMKWLEKKGDQFDVIFIDPPTFSNSKDRHKNFDVQKDHYDMLMLAKKHLHPDGKIIFSNNFRRFKLDERLSMVFRVTDITAKSIPEDFKRNMKIHQCWTLESL